MGEPTVNNNDLTVLITFWRLVESVELRQNVVPCTHRQRGWCLASHYSPDSLYRDLLCSFFLESWLASVISAYLWSRRVEHRCFNDAHRGFTRRP